MKNILLIIALLCSYGINHAVAQGCAGKANAEARSSCSSAKAQAETSAQMLCEDTKALALKMAANAEDIHAKVCEESGAVSFTKVSKCCTSGAETSQAVHFDSEKKEFVNVAPSESIRAEAKPVRTSIEAEAPANERRSCQGSSSVKKSCSGNTSAKACCQSRKASSQTSAASSAQREQ